jgi:hypothetical protein
MKKIGLTYTIAITGFVELGMILDKEPLRAVCFACAAFSFCALLCYLLDKP